MRRTSARYNYRKVQYRTALMNPQSVARKNSGFDEPYINWRRKQQDLFRNVLEAQYEHLRKVYRRQWYEAYIVNADEYITKYNVTKAAQLAQWESEMHAQETKRRDAYEMASGRAALKSKHLDILREYHERKFFHWYERASERLQAAARLPFIPREKLEQHIEAELRKYAKAGEAEPAKEYPLNFVGQMPLIEDEDLTIVAAAAHQYDTVRADFPKRTDIGLYEPPLRQTAAQAAASAAVRTLAEIDEAERKIAAAVLDEMALDEEARKVEHEDFGTRSATSERAHRRAYTDRSRVMAKHATGSSTVSVALDGPGPTIAESKEFVKDTKAQARAERKKQQEAFNRAQKFEGGAAAPVPSGIKGQIDDMRQAASKEREAAPAVGSPDVKIGEIRTAKLRRREATEEQIQKLAAMVGPDGRGAIKAAKAAIPKVRGEAQPIGAPTNKKP